MNFKKRAKNFFRFKRLSRAKNGVKKTREKFFEDSHEYRGKKIVGKKTCEIFFEDSHEYRK